MIRLDTMYDIQRDTISDLNRLIKNLEEKVDILTDTILHITDDAGMT